jgi:hypothetical protein
VGRNDEWSAGPASVDTALNRFVESDWPFARYWRFGPESGYGTSRTNDVPQKMSAIGAGPDLCNSAGPSPRARQLDRGLLGILVETGRRSQSSVLCSNPLQGSRWRLASVSISLASPAKPSPPTTPSAMQRWRNTSPSLKRPWRFFGKGRVIRRLAFQLQSEPAKARFSQVAPQIRKINEAIRR